MSGERLESIEAENQLLRAWLQWCLDNCDDSPEHNFGTTSTKFMNDLLAGKDVPFPPDRNSCW